MKVCSVWKQLNLAIQSKTLHHSIRTLTTFLTSKCTCLRKLQRKVNNHLRASVHQTVLILPWARHRMKVDSKVAKDRWAKSNTASDSVSSTISSNNLLWILWRIFQGLISRIIRWSWTTLSLLEIKYQTTSQVFSSLRHQTSLTIPWAQPRSSFQHLLTRVTSLQSTARVRILTTLQGIWKCRTQLSELASRLWANQLSAPSHLMTLAQSNLGMTALWSPQQSHHTQWTRWAKARCTRLSTFTIQLMTSRSTSHANHRD